MNLASQIAPRSSVRSIFSIDASPVFAPAGFVSGVQNVLVQPIKQLESDPASINEFTSGLGIAGVPRCYVNSVLGLNRILRPEPLADEYGMRPISAMTGMGASAAPMPPAFVR